MRRPVFYLSPTGESSLSVKGHIKEAAGYVKEEANENSKTAEGQQKAAEGRALRNEGRIEDGKAPKTGTPASTNTGPKYRPRKRPFVVMHGRPFSFSMSWPTGVSAIQLK